MPIVNTNYFQEDAVPTAAQLNQPYDQLAIASTGIEPINTAPNWVTRKHMSQSATVCNDIYAKIDNASTSFTTSSTTYVTINNSSLTEVILNYQPEQYEILRANASGLVTNIDVNVNFNNQLPAADQGKPNYYAFQLLLEYNDGGPTQQLTLGEWGYSFTNLSGGRYHTSTGGSSVRTGTPIAFQTFQFSTLHRYDGVAGVRTYEKLILQCKVYDASNVLAISRNAAYAIRAKA